MVKKFSDLRKIIFLTSTPIYSQKSKSTTEVWYSYNDITLKLYLHIAATGDVMQLIREGQAETGECLERWEKLIADNSQANNSFEYSDFLNKNKSYAALISEHTLVKLILIRLSLEYDADLCLILKKKGYNIDVNNYEQSLISALRKSENFVTKIKMKENELSAYDNKKKVSQDSFEEIMANMIFATKMNLPDDITLARYNALKKLVKRQNDVKKHA